VKDARAFKREGQTQSVDYLTIEYTYRPWQSVESAWPFEEARKSKTYRRIDGRWYIEAESQNGTHLDLATDMWEAALELIYAQAEATS
jgi:hypothetical protein